MGVGVAVGRAVAVGGAVAVGVTGVGLAAGGCVVGGAAAVGVSVGTVGVFAGAGVSLSVTGALVDVTESGTADAVGALVAPGFSVVATGELAASSPHAIAGRSNSASKSGAASRPLTALRNTWNAILGDSCLRLCLLGFPKSNLTY